MKSQIKKAARNFLEHNEWIKFQFKNALRPRLRDVLVHASFIETIVRYEADPNFKTQFGPSLGNLKLLRKKCGLYSDGRLDEIEKLWNIRNDLIHAIIKNKFDEAVIIKKIYQMRDLIKVIHRGPNFVINFLQKTYKINLFDLVVKDVNRSILLGSEET